MIPEMNSQEHAMLRAAKLELAELTQDMEHVLNCTDAGIIFLDREMHIRKFSPRVAIAFDLMEKDIGRKVSAVAHRIQQSLGTLQN